MCLWVQVTFPLLIRISLLMLFTVIEGSADLLSWTCNPTLATSRAFLVSSGGNTSNVLRSPDVQRLQNWYVLTIVLVTN